MSQRYVVRQGDCLWTIARDFGFVDWRRIYNYADNADLRRQRPNPDVLLPGDVVVIPDKIRATISRPTDEVHRFMVRNPKPRKLNIKLKDTAGNTLADEPYFLTLGSAITKGTTSSGGEIHADLVPDVTVGTLELPNHPHVTWELRIASLDPVIDPTSKDPIVTGLQARLNNLSYTCGGVDGEVASRTTRATKQFQKIEMKLDAPNGVADSALCDKLTTLYGC